MIIFAHSTLAWCVLGFVGLCVLACVYNLGLWIYVYSLQRTVRARKIGRAVSQAIMQEFLGPYKNKKK